MWRFSKHRNVNTGQREINKDGNGNDDELPSSSRMIEKPKIRKLETVLFRSDGSPKASFQGQVRDVITCKGDNERKESRKGDQSEDQGSDTQSKVLSESNINTQRNERGIDEKSFNKFTKKEHIYETKVALKRLQKRCHENRKSVFNSTILQQKTRERYVSIVSVPEHFQQENTKSLKRMEKSKAMTYLKRSRNKYTTRNKHTSIDFSKVKS